MPASLSEAIQAYHLAAKQKTPPSSPTIEPTSRFADLVKQGYTATKQAGLEGERQSIQAIAGQANLPEVVQAISKAEVTLQTMVSVRDRVVQSYQEVIRMPL